MPAAETKKPAPISIAGLSTQLWLWLIRRHTPNPRSVRQASAKKLVAMLHAALSALADYIWIISKDECKTCPLACCLRVLSEGENELLRRTIRRRRCWPADHGVLQGRGAGHRAGPSARVKAQDRSHLLNEVATEASFLTGGFAEHHRHAASPRPLRDNPFYCNAVFCRYLPLGRRLFRRSRGGLS